MSDNNDTQVQSSPPLREDIIESAVRFLADPKVHSSTLAKKISFLESKGLTNEEIEDALARARNSQSGASQNNNSNSTDAVIQQPRAAATNYAQPMAPPSGPPPRPHLDWKDYFIAAVMAGGLGYGLYMLAKKYIRPMLLAQDDNRRLEEEKELLVEQNEQTRKQLEVLTESTTRILESLSQQSLKTSEAIEGMTSVMDKISENSAEQNSSSRRLMVILEDLQKEIGLLTNKTKRSGDASIADVQSDIRSLRSLLLSRRVPAHGGPSSSGRPATPSAVTAADNQNGVASSPQLGSTVTTAAAAAIVTADIDNDADGKSSPTTSAASLPTPTIPAWQLALTGEEGESSAGTTVDKGKQPAVE